MNLMQGIEDRTVTLSQYLAYQDEHETVVFQHDHIGRIVQKPRGKHKVPWLNVVAMEADNGKTLAEAAAAGDLDDPERLAKTGDAWHAFLDWIKQPRVNES